MPQPNPQLCRVSTGKNSTLRFTPAGRSIGFDMSRRQSSTDRKSRRGSAASPQRRLVEEHFEVGDHCSLTALIAALEAFRTAAKGDELEVTLVGDDDFGRRLRITYFREVTAEEAALERKYQVPATAIPTRRIALRPVVYEEHRALLWGGDVTGIPPFA